MTGRRKAYICRQRMRITCSDGSVTYSHEIYEAVATKQPRISTSAAGACACARPQGHPPTDVTGDRSRPPGRRFSRWKPPGLSRPPATCGSAASRVWLALTWPASSPDSTPLPTTNKMNLMYVALAIARALNFRREMPYADAPIHLCVLFDLTTD